LEIRVELVQGHAADLWPRPGRVFVAARTHTFTQFADAIDAAFARWDLAHLHLFYLGDGRRVSRARWWEDDDFGMPVVDGDRLTLGRLALGEQFVYEFDLGDSWTHLCTVGEARIDPTEALGIVPPVPVAYWGWGEMPDQYGRRWEGDDGETRVPRDPRGKDLPALGPWEWRNRPRGAGADRES
jgi:hypothetical protein